MSMDQRVNDRVAAQIGHLVMQVAVMEARNQQLGEELAAANARIAELEATHEPV